MKGADYLLSSFKGDFSKAVGRGVLHMGLCGVPGFPLQVRISGRLRSF